MGLSTRETQHTVEDLKRKVQELREEARAANLVIEQLEGELKAERQTTKQIENAIINARLQAETIEANAKQSARQLIEVKEQEMQAQVDKFNAKFIELKAAAYYLSKQERDLKTEFKLVLNEALMRIEKVHQLETNTPALASEQDEEKLGTTIQFPEAIRPAGAEKTPLYGFSGK